MGVEMPAGLTAFALTALVGILVGGGATLAVTSKRDKGAEAQAAADIAQAEAMGEIADAGVRQAEAITPLVAAVQGLELMRADLRADLAGAAGLPVGCLDPVASMAPVCVAVKCWQFQQSDAGRSSPDECTKWSVLARAQAGE